jgi:molecular chaperone GrpE (heat shock protein)
MSGQMEPRISKWPFLLGDGLLLGLAGFIYYQSTLPMGPWQIGFVVLCVAGGAWLAIMPFLLEYRVVAKLAEADALATVVAQLQKLETVAAQIGNATGQWQTVHEEAAKTAAAAKAIAERMGKEVQGFTEFMQQANDGEKATLRLEVEKLRRAEADWLQVLVRMLDHVYALHNGALRSGQPNLIENLNNFQNACRDAARRVGLMPFQPTPAERFDAQRHQVANGDGQPSPDAVVRETIASGYTFQGRLLRPAMVRLSDHAAETVPEPAPAPGLTSDGREGKAARRGDGQSQLPLDQTGETPA